MRPSPNRDREYAIAHRVGVLIQIALLRDDRVCDRLARPLSEPRPSPNLLPRPFVAAAVLASFPGSAVPARELAVQLRQEPF
jgi:hypothetical protein